ncbi:MAG: response regulator [Treponema sp.]|nr:response regulator [Treponema sp.]
MPGPGGVGRGLCGEQGAGGREPWERVQTKNMENEKKLIIMIDDNITNLRLGENVLSEHFDLATAPSAAKFFKLLEKNDPDLILLDIDMPEMDGYETIKILKSKQETKDIPVIFLTAKSESEDELEGLSLGAVDYITKPFQPSLLLKRIEVHLLVQEQQRTLQYFNDNLYKALSTYLSGEVVDEIIADPTRLQLGGVKRHMSAMFTDIRNFTSIAEVLTPEQLVELLNNYLSAMSDIILEQKGTIDKFVGDAIISFFGAPMELPDHAMRACTAAIKMKRIEATVNKNITKNGMLPIFTRIGINTGEMVVGNMGTEKKMNYTVIGNAVNLAARIEGINKQYGTSILCTENTIKETDGKFLSRRLDLVRVAGINEPVRIYEVLETNADAPAALHNMVNLFHKAQLLFESRDWEEAEKLFNQLLELSPDDEPSIIYRDRCEHYYQSPPDRDWDGIVNFLEK